MNEFNRSPAGRRFLIWGGIATLILVSVVIITGSQEFDLNLDDFALDDVLVESDILGTAMQQLFVPFVGIFLLSTTPFFQKAVSNQPTPNYDQRVLGLALLAILIFNLIATVWQNDEFFLGVTDGQLIVIVGGLLLGSRTGILLGLFTMAFYAINSYALELPNILEEDLFDPLVWTIFDLELLATIWAGTVIGLWRDAKGRLPFNPYRLFVLGFLVEWLSAWLALIGYGEYVLLDQLPAALISGLSLMVLGFLTQQVLGREREVRLAAAEQAQSQAELKALRAQINPHFLFNALSTIKYHARTHPETAYDLLDDLSDVFHTALRSEPFVRLEEELDTMRSYLAIEQARLRERLTVTVDIDPAVDLNLQIPALILQPIVENSVIHGIAPKANGGTISVRVTPHGAGCHILIRDNGAGFDPENYTPAGSGIGLANSTERLIAVYGSEFAPHIQSTQQQGTSVSITIPAEKYI